MSGALYIHHVGMACPLGLTADSALAAIRCGLDRKQELAYRDASGEPLRGSLLGALDPELTRRQRWLQLLAFAFEDAVQSAGADHSPEIPVVCAVPSDARQTPSLEEALVTAFAESTGGSGPRHVEVIGAAASDGFRALARARELLQSGGASAVWVCAGDSLVNAPALLALSRRGRLLTSDNSDGVIPGEAAACLLVRRERAGALAAVLGLGFAEEPAQLDSDLPLRGDGVFGAARAALDEAGLTLDQIDFRLSDAAGEGYAFKEQALLVARGLTRRRADFPLWLTALSLGDVGAASALCATVWAASALECGNVPGPRAIALASDTAARRAAIVLEAVA